jgi:ubiquinone/menaquinone biosynthesis C-methylase UbiE
MASNRYLFLPNYLMNRHPDWKMPVGISQQLWTYVQSPSVAADYDQDLGESPLFQNDLGLARQFLGNQGTILDLGCGTGRLVTAFQQTAANVVGIDLSWEMLCRAARKTQAMSSANATFIRANIVQLDFLRDGAFDHAVCLFSTLGMMPRKVDRESIVQNVFRVLKPGGRFLLHVHNYYHHLGTKIGRRWIFRDLLRRLAGNADAGNYEAPTVSESAVTLHHFTLREARGLLRRTGFKVQLIVPISLRPDCKLRWSWFLPGLRAYGFLIGAVK